MKIQSSRKNQSLNYGQKGWSSLYHLEATIVPIIIQSSLKAKRWNIVSSWKCILRLGENWKKFIIHAIHKRNSQCLMCYERNVNLSAFSCSRHSILIIDPTSRNIVNLVRHWISKFVSVDLSRRSYLCFLGSTQKKYQNRKYQCWFWLIDFRFWLIENENNDNHDWNENK